jgi:hypothetical protein
LQATNEHDPNPRHNARHAGTQRDSPPHARTPTLPCSVPYSTRSTRREGAHRPDQTHHPPPNTALMRTVHMRATHHCQPLLGPLHLCLCACEGGGQGVPTSLGVADLPTDTVQFGLQVTGLGFDDAQPGLTTPQQEQRNTRTHRKNMRDKRRTRNQYLHKQATHTRSRVPKRHTSKSPTKEKECHQSDHAHSTSPTEYGTCNWSRWAAASST